MTIRHLKIFLAVVETGSMSTAAKQLFLSQPTVSQSIHELEEHYQITLFERLSRKLYITEAGIELVSVAKQVVELFDSMERKMFHYQTETLRLGTTLTIGTCLLQDIISKLQQNCPNLKTYNYIANTAKIEELLLTSKLDVGIVEGNILSPDLIAVPLIKDFLVLVCSASHPILKQPNLKIDDLNNLSFAMREQGSGTRALFEHYLNQHNLQIHIALESDSPYVIIQSILHQNLLSAMSIRLVAEEIEKGKMAILSEPDEEWSRYFKLVYHKNKLITPPIELLKSILESMSQYGIPDFKRAF